MMNLKEALTLYQGMPQFENVKLSSPNEMGSDEEAPIHIACRLGNLNHVDIFLKNDADPNLIGDIGNTPLHFAALCGHASVVKLLLEWGGQKNCKNEFGETPLDVAINGHHHEVERLLATQKL